MVDCKLQKYILEVCLPSFPQIHRISAVAVVGWEEGRLSALFYAVLCATIVHSTMHTHMNRHNSVCWLDVTFLWLYYVTVYYLLDLVFLGLFYVIVCVCVLLFCWI